MYFLSVLFASIDEANIQLLCPDLAMLAASSLVSTTFSIVQQGRDITWYRDMVTAQFEYKIRKPGNDPELAVAGGSIGVDAVLFYFRRLMKTTILAFDHSAHTFLLSRRVL